MFILAAPSAPSIKSWSTRSALNLSFQSLCHVHYCYTRLCYTVKGFETPIFIKNPVEFCFEEEKKELLAKMFVLCLD